MASASIFVSVTPLFKVIKGKSPGKLVATTKQIYIYVSRDTFSCVCGTEKLYFGREVEAFPAKFVTTYTGFSLEEVGHLQLC